MNEERREVALKLRVGVFVLLALAAFIGMIYALGARARLFEARYTIHAEFREVGGLAEGATVRLAGVQIGRVSAVRLPPQPGGRVRVDLTIARQFADRIRRDSIARIETQGLLGDKIIEVTVGTAAAPALGPGEMLEAREPTDIHRILSEGAETVRNVAALTVALRQTAEMLGRSNLVEDASAAVQSARRLTDRLERAVARAEQGPGWIHTLLYEEPVALRRLNDLIGATGRILDRVERGQGAVGVLASPETTAAARRFVAALDRFGRLAEPGAAPRGLLPAVLFEPEYRAVLDDLRAVARNLREISERLASGRGALGVLVRDEPADEVRRTLDDLRTAVANLRAISARVNEGEGTLGALLADPTLYERLVAIVEGAQRSLLLRTLIRGLGGEERREPAQR